MLVEAQLDIIDTNDWEELFEIDSEHDQEEEPKTKSILHIRKLIGPIA